MRFQFNVLTKNFRYMFANQILVRIDLIAFSTIVNDFI